MMNTMKYMSQIILLLVVIDISSILIVQSKATTTTTTTAMNNFRPIIGVVSEPISPEMSQELYNNNNNNDDDITTTTTTTTTKKATSYIAASYVKYLEMAGARVVPLIYNQPSDDIDTLLKGINGILFPGGGACLQSTNCPFFESASRMFKYAIQSNDNGNYFPVWGTCLGFQFLSVMGAGENQTVLSSGFDSEDLPLPLNFTSSVTNSKLFANAPTTVMTNLKTKPITMNAHHSGVTPKAGKNNKQFADFYTVLSTNNGRQGKEFISTIEAKKYPIYGTQYHPEKINFEWVIEKEPIPHTFDAVVASQYFANFFVNEARKSNIKLENENDYLIYNYNTNFTGKSGGYFTETYFFYD